MSGSQSQLGGTQADTSNDPSMEDILASIRRILSEEDAPASKKPAASDTASEQDVLILDRSMLVPDAAPRAEAMRSERPRMPPAPPLTTPPPAALVEVAAPPPLAAAEPPVGKAEPPVLTERAPSSLAEPGPRPPSSVAPPEVVSPLTPSPVLSSGTQTTLPAPPLNRLPISVTLVPVPQPGPATPARTPEAEAGGAAVTPPPPQAATPPFSPPSSTQMTSTPITHATTQPESSSMSASMPSSNGIASTETTAQAAGSVSNLVRALTSDRGAQVSSGGPTIADIVREEMRPMLKSWLDSNLAPMVERLVRAEIDRVIARATL